MKVSTGGITEISTIDFPGHVASVVYMCQCPYRCPFCQNFTLLDKKNCKDIESSEIVKKVMENFPLISGVCITGGEPTMQLEGLIEICEGVKKNDLAVKLDTNGFYPDRVQKVLDLDLVDYIAMDIKAPLIPEKYGKAVGRKDGEEVVKRVKETLSHIADSGVKFEPRTTIVPLLIHKEEDVRDISTSLKKYSFDFYVLQQFRPNGGCLDKEYENYASPPRDYLLEVAKAVKNTIPEVWLRTKENGEEKV